MRAREVTLGLAVAAALAGASCKKKPPPDARTAPSASASEMASSPAGSSSVEVSLDAPSPFADPPRVKLRSPEETHVLRAHASVVRAHFGDVPLALQMVALGGDRRALLLSAWEGDAKAFLLVVDARQNLLWSRERPLAGPRPGVRQVTLAAGPDGEVLTVWHDTDSSVVAARRWTAEGGLLADFQVMDADGCDAIAALYWPGAHGWVLVASQQGTTRAQLLTTKGHRAWGRGGRTVFPGWRGPAPLGLALDGADGVILVQPGYAANGLTRDVPDRYFAARLDDGGRPTWPASLDLGEAPRPAAAPFPKPLVEPVAPGVVRATLAKGTTDAPLPYDIEVTESGRVLLRLGREILTTKTRRAQKQREEGRDQNCWIRSVRFVFWDPTVLARPF